MVLDRVVREGEAFGQHMLVSDRLRGQKPLTVVHAVTAEKTVLIRLEVPLFNNYLSTIDAVKSLELKSVGLLWRDSMQPDSIRCFFPHARTNTEKEGQRGTHTYV